MRRAALRAAVALSLAAPVTAAEHLGSHVWRPGWHGAGGYSALWLDDDGAAFVALSDGADWVRGRLERGPGGAVSGVIVEARGDLLGPDGRGRDGDEDDSEGIARVGDTFYVSFEKPHGVDRYVTLDAPGEPLARHPDFDGFGLNGGLEALAADAEGRLYGILEQSGGGHIPFAVYRYEDGAWTQPFAIPRERGSAFLVVGSDVGPDGRLYVLERGFALIGFRSRLRSYALDGTDGRDELASALFDHDNLEGLAVWRDAQGRLRATMISDDNFRSVQRTEFVDYVLD